jgi:hypothetical protein
VGTAVAKCVTGARGRREFRRDGGRIGEARPLQTEGEHDEEQDGAAIHSDECNASRPGQACRRSPATSATFRDETAICG